MTAVIGFCLPTGAFLAADSRRVDVPSGRTWPEPIRKIVPLTRTIVIMTGGLGTIGHIARDVLLSYLQNSKLPLSKIVVTAADVFRTAYDQSQLQHPGHLIPLTCIIAGQDPVNHSGFICALGNQQNFEPFWVRGIGQPYFAGSNTTIVQNCATATIFELYRTKKKLQLDEWAVESFHRISQVESSVALPAQLVMVDSQITDLFPVDKAMFRPHPRFRISFPKL